MQNPIQKTEYWANPTPQKTKCKLSQLIMHGENKELLT
jgi:hypothetical protein